MPRKEYRAKMTPEQISRMKGKNALYQKTPAGRKSHRICTWKTQLKIECDDWDALYEKYMSCNNCECCGNEFNKEQKDKHMDHCHKTNKPRNILCRRCNQLRGHFEKDYLVCMKLMTMA